MKLKLLLSLLLGVTLTCAYANEEVNLADVDIVEADESEYSSGSVDMVLQEWGNNEAGIPEFGTAIPKKDSFYLAFIGTGIIHAKPTDPVYNSERATAFSAAMLAAKIEMSRYLGQVIEAAISNNTLDGSELEGLDDAGKAAALALTNAPAGSAIANLCKSIQGANTDNVEVRKEKISNATRAAIAGAQAYKTVEGDGEVGVILIWSPKLFDTAASMTNGEMSKKFTPKQTIAAQVKAMDKKELLSTFGVQQMINEKGELCIVAFGQAGAKSSGKRSRKNAQGTARLNADAEIRRFAGEQVAGYDTLAKMSAGVETMDGDAAYANVEAYNEFQESYAKGLTFEGIATPYQWEAIHPVSGKPVYGIVRSWNASAAQLARKLKKQIEAVAAPAAEGKRDMKDTSGPSKSQRKRAGTAPTVKQEDFFGFGAAGDDDAF